MGVQGRRDRESGGWRRYVRDGRVWILEKELAEGAAKIEGLEDGIGVAVGGGVISDWKIEVVGSNTE